MKKYKLIKQYPGSPKLGFIVHLRHCGMYHNIETGNLYGSQHIENQPEFWQEVIEKDYEILSFSSNLVWNGNLAVLTENGRYSPNPGVPSWTLDEILNKGISVKSGHIQIHSVKRLSDGEIFTIGDRAKTITSKGKHTVTQLNIRQKCTGRDGKGGYNYDGIDRIWIGWEDDCGGNWLESTEKLKQPIFLTHDGRDIFEGDRVIWVNKDSLHHDTFTATQGVKFHSDLNAYFLSAVDAQNYIKKNTPVYITEDGVKVYDYDTQQYWVIDGDFAYCLQVNEANTKLVKDRPNTYKLFSTKQAAEEYVEKNRVLFTTEDGVGIKKGDKYYFVDTDFSVTLAPNATDGSGKYPERKYFATLAAAENCAIQHSRVLSIEDFWEFVSWGGSNVAKSKRLKRLVKERLNLK